MFKMRFFFSVILTVIMAKIIYVMTNNKFDIFSIDSNIFDFLIQIAVFIIIFYLSQKLVNSVFPLKNQD